MDTSFKNEHPELKKYKNGTYPRPLDTKYGYINQLSVPRDRDTAFQTSVFVPYGRREQWLGETIIVVSERCQPREISYFIERIVGRSYSHVTVRSQM